MPRGGAPKRPKDLRRTLRTFFAYLGHARLSLLVVAVLVTASGAANLVGTYMGLDPVVMPRGESSVSNIEDVLPTATMC